MCNQRDRHIIHLVNRLMIGAASVVGVSMDGIGSGDLFCIASTGVWLMQAEFSVLEERLVDFWRQH